MLPQLSTNTVWAILREEIDDATVNHLLWYHIGYRWNEEKHSWDNALVDPYWWTDYPTPPDFIGDRISTLKLTRSIPQENKQLLKQKLGFKGYKIGEFTPAQARRATAANWLLSYMTIEGILE